MKKHNPVIKDFCHILHGGDYNPDQWVDTPEIWEEDMRLMNLAHCNTFSVGIFAWSALEPSEGEYNFGWLDTIMDKLAENGKKVFLATPSGARPPWLAQKYPEVLRVYNGVRQKFGGRHNHCFSSPIYREKVGKINRQLALRYKDHPALAGWHVSNEYSGSCHCEYCQENFRKWLKNKYKTLDELNHQWWTAFWSHTYTDWSQIEPPQSSGETGVHGLNIDWLRFATDMTADFFRNEIAPIREITPHLPVTANLMGFEYSLDYRVLAKELDFVSYDHYPRWHGNETVEETAVNSAMTLDLNYGLSHKPFIMLESTPSLVNWHEYNTLKRPGMHITGSLQAVAHGSDSVMYFQWRKSRGCTEKFHGAVVDHCGHENTRVFKEVADLGEILEKLDSVVGTTADSKVAIIYDWDNHWALNDLWGLQRNDKKIYDTWKNWYRPFWKRGINVELIGRNDDFSQYSVIIAPMMYMTTDETVEKIKEFVGKGGSFVGTYTMGTVNENDLCHLGGIPHGELKDVFGLWAEEIDTLYPGNFNLVSDNNGNEYKAVDYCELVHPRGAEVLATYKTDFYKGMPAVLCNSYGKGKAYYVAFRDDGDYADALASELCKGLKCAFDGNLASGVTAHSRTDGKNDFVFLQNFTDEERTVVANREYENVVTGEKMAGKITLKPYETIIVSEKR